MAVPLDLPALVAGALDRAMRQVDRVLARAVATGEDARAVAAKIGKFLNPRWSPRRNPTGARVREDRPGSGGAWPARPGMASAGVRLVAEHEINSAAAGRIVTIAQRTPGFGLEWLLAPSHKELDRCNDFADADNGYGPGVYLPRDMPPLPAHVRCMCYTRMVPLP